MMSMITVVLLVQIISTGFASKGTRIPNFAGPVTARVKQLCPCPDEMTGRNKIRISGFIQQTREQTHPTFHLNFENDVPIDDTLQLTGTVASWNSVAGWIPNAFIIKFDKLCTSLKSHLRGTMETLEKYSVNGLKFCPRSSGNFTVRGAPTVFNPDGLAFKTLPYGLWRGDFSYLQNKETISCFRLIFQTTPRINE